MHMVESADLSILQLEARLGSGPRTGKTGRTLHTQFIPRYQIRSVEADDLPGDSEVVTYKHRRSICVHYVPQAWPHDNSFS
jgi:hypothetical protein